MDELLFQSVKEGDVYAFKILFTKYYRKLCKYCFSFVREKETAEEVVSDVFQLLWERKEQIEINTKFSSYLFSFTRNYSLNIVRQRKGAPTFEFIEENSHDEISNMEDPLFWYRPALSNGHWLSNWTRPCKAANSAKCIWRSAWPPAAPNWTGCLTRATCPSSSIL